MQELRLVAVSEDGTYAVLAVPGRGGRFTLPIDDRLRTVARGQFSRLAQYEIEVENPLRPKEIQDRIRAGETADEIADAAGIPIERVRRFEGPVLAEREYRAQEAQRATVRGHTESGPGPRLGEIVLERLADVGAPTDALEWDSRKRTDGNWQVQLQFAVDGRPQLAEWVFDPRRRQVMPADDLARRLCLPQVEWPAGRLGGLGGPTATVTPIGSRMGANHGEPRAEPDRVAARAGHAAGTGLPGSQRSGHQQEAARPHEGGRDTSEPGQSRELASAAGRDAAGQAAPPAAARPGAAAGQRPDQPAAASAATTGRHAAPGHPAAGDYAATGRAEAGNGGQAAAGLAEAGTAGQAPGNAPAHAPGDAAPSPEAVAAESAETKASARSGRKAARGRRSSVPSWDEIMLGTSRQPD